MRKCSAHLFLFIFLFVFNQIKFVIYQKWTSNLEWISNDQFIYLSKRLDWQFDLVFFVFMKRFSRSTSSLHKNVVSLRMCHLRWTIQFVVLLNISLDVFEQVMKIFLNDDDENVCFFFFFKILFLLLQQRPVFCEVILIKHFSLNGVAVIDGVPMKTVF